MKTSLRKRLATLEFTRSQFNEIKEPEGLPERQKMLDILHRNWPETKEDLADDDLDVVAITKEILARAINVPLECLP